MTAIDTVIPVPRLLEVDHVDLAISADRAWHAVRHARLGVSPLVRALFAIRTLGVTERDEAVGLSVDGLVSSAAQPGFQVLVDDPPHEVVVGAIGKVWRLDIPFVHVPSAAAFAAFHESGFIKVAWALRVSKLGAHGSRVTIEVRVDATDEVSWRRFRRYFRVIGPGSHFVRRSALNELSRLHGAPDDAERERAMIGDDLLSGARAQATHGVTIAASPGEIWPWLVQMGCGRAGFYSLDALDNGGLRSAREVHPELQALAVGDHVPASPGGASTFEVLQLEPGRALVLGGLYDTKRDRQLAFRADRPGSFWQSTWAFELEALDERTTRLHVRGRAAYSDDHAVRAAWVRGAHWLMQTAQLRHLAMRAEGRLPLDDWRDMAGGLGGAAIIGAALLTPFMRQSRSHWGLSAEQAARAYPGDELVADPLWSWTHAVEIDAEAAAVWPWIAQIGADRAGFYSYQWLENIAGCRVRNAESVHPEWAVEREGSSLLLHPRMPPLRVVGLNPGHWFVAHAGGADDPNRRADGTWVEVSWLFLLESTGPGRSRFISRYRCACSHDLATRVSFGPGLMEPIGFAMDRRMLLGVKERAERPAPPAH